MAPLAFGALGALLLFIYQPLTAYWLSLSVIFDVVLGAIPFLVLVIVYPRIYRRATAMISIPERQTTDDFVSVTMADEATRMSNKVVKAFKLKRKAGPLTRPAHIHTWFLFTWFKLIAWSLVIGVFGDLILSEGWRAPLSWSAIVYDLIYARANDQPNGAHILSYLGVPIFGLVVAYKYGPRVGPEKYLGDILQGIAAAGFLGAVHEIMWITLYYIAYAQYLSWSILPEVIRDVSFVILLLFLIATYWKFQGRKTPMLVYKWPVVAYGVLLLAWFFVPVAFGFHIFPITTINNPQFGTGLYQETPWFSLWWVNALEVWSWIQLYVSFIYVVVRDKQRT